MKRVVDLLKVMCPVITRVQSRIDLFFPLPLINFSSYKMSKHLQQRFSDNRMKTSL